MEQAPEKETLRSSGEKLPEEENVSRKNQTEEISVKSSEGEQDEVTLKKLPEQMFYDYEQLESKASVSPESQIPLNLLHLSHSFGYDCKRRANLQLLDEHTLVFVAGNFLVLQDLISTQQRYLRSSGGGGIGAITTHPEKQYFAVGERGRCPNIIIYQWPSLRPYRILRGGTGRAYCHLDFSADGQLLVSVGAAPDYMLTLWDWTQEEVLLSCKAVSQEVYRVSFSPHDPGLLTSCGSGHIKFWKMTRTFTGLKLQGLMGHFGKTAATDIESYVVLQDGKVVSGTDWGNLLLWDGNAVKVEIGRKDGRTCHTGVALPFAIEEGQLLTTGADGAVRGWDLESIDGADIQGEGPCFELEPMNELEIGHNVSLSSVVRSARNDSFIWFAQDAMGAIWKLDLSFTHTTPDPESLFQFHCGPIQGLDVSRSSHLMVTTALGCSVKVFDFLSKKQLTSSRFNQGGTSVCWAPPQVERGGGLLTVGFQDGVVRFLDVFDPQGLQSVPGRSRRGGAELRLRQAFKPHSSSVTAVAFDRDAGFLATGSSDCSVFFFHSGEKFQPIGFVPTPGPVQALEWSPPWHRESRLLVLCQTGHVLEVHRPDVDPPPEHRLTYQLFTLNTRAFCFKSIKSRLQGEQEAGRRQENKGHQHENSELEPEEEPEEELTPIHLPNPPSPLCCGFYSQPGRFWLSMGGYDAGFLYHCEFSEEQVVDPSQRQDEPFKALPLHDADQDPVTAVTFSSERRLLLLGMSSGSLRVYPLSPGDHSLESMQHYWTLSIHDNGGGGGALRHLRVSHDQQFVLTAGDDGNIFSFSLLPPEQLPQATSGAKVPSPRGGLELEGVAQDIEDPSAHSMEAARRRLQSDRGLREAEEHKQKQRGILKVLQHRYRQLVAQNQALPAHVRLQHQELRLDLCLVERAQEVKGQRVRRVQREVAWEHQKSRLARDKLHTWFRDARAVTLVAMATEHRVTTYLLPAATERTQEPLRRRSQSSSSSSSTEAVRRGRAEPGRGASSVTEEATVPATPVGPRPAPVGPRPAPVGPRPAPVGPRPAPVGPRPPAVRLADRQVERLKNASEKAKQAREKIQKRKEEWAQLCAEKPDENHEDPQDLQALVDAQETLGDLKLKSSPDFTVPKHLRLTTSEKREELRALEDKMRRRQTEMNARIIALRDSKLQLVSHLQSLSAELRRVQRRLPAESHLPCPALPHLHPEETPERRPPCTPAALLRYKELKDTWSAVEDQDQDGASDVLQQLWKEMEVGQHTEDTQTESRSVPDLDPEEDQGPETQLEVEVQMEEQVQLLYRQDCIIEQIQGAVCEWDAALRTLLHQKLLLDQELKLADLRALTVLQELQLLKQFESREESLQSKLSAKAREEDAAKLKLQELNEELDSHKQEISKLQERELALSAAFVASIGENNKFEEFLTRVFKKNIKRLKKEKTAEEAEEEEDSEEEEEDEEWDEDDEEEEEDEDGNGGVPQDDSVCPPNCDPALLENTLQLRERKVEVKEQLQKVKKTTEVLQKDCERLAKKVKNVQSSRKAVEDELELMHREKQQQTNELDVVVPLCLHQILLSPEELQTELDHALVLEHSQFQRLQNRIPELQQEKNQQRALFRQARQQHARLLQDNAHMETRIQVLNKECEEQMMQKFGRLVDLEALQTLSGNRALEELKYEKRLREEEHSRQLRLWDLKVEEAREDLMKATKDNTERMARLIGLLNQKRGLEQDLNARQKKRVTFLELQSRRDQQDLEHLQEAVKVQAQEAQALRTEIQLLSRKGGSILPPGPAPRPRPAASQSNT